MELLPLMGGWLLLLLVAHLVARSRGLTDPSSFILGALRGSALVVVVLLIVSLAFLPSL